MHAVQQQPVLLVGNNVQRLKQIADQLSTRNLSSTLETCMKRGQEMISKARHCALIVHEDVMGEAFVPFCQSIRDADPLIVIIASLAQKNAVLEEKLLDLGMDDVVDNTAHPNVVAKRVLLRLQKRCRVDCNDGIVHLKDAVVDFKRLEVWNRGRIYPISRGLANLLKYFLDNCGRTISRQQASDILWADSIVDPEGKNLDVHVSKLRQLIEPDPKHPTLITTVRGSGYKLAKCF